MSKVISTKSDSYTEFKGMPLKANYLFDFFIATALIPAFAGLLYDYKILELIREIGIVAGIIYVALNYKRVLDSNSKTIVFFLLSIFALLASTNKISSAASLIATIAIIFSRIERNGLSSLTLVKFPKYILFLTFTSLVALTFYELGFDLLTNMMNINLNNQNYIASMVFCIFILFYRSRSSIDLMILMILFVILFALGSRTALVSVVMLFIATSTLKTKILIFIFSPIWGAYIYQIFLNKWDSSSLAEAASGRTGPWIYYIELLVGNNMSIFPRFISGVSVDSYQSNLTGLFHGPHNIFIQALIEFGWLVGFVFILVVFASIYRARKTPLFGAYVAMVTYSFFEPTVWFSTNLISFLFFFMFSALTSQLISDCLQKK